MKWFEMLSKVISYPISYRYLINYIQLMGNVPHSKLHELEVKKSTLNIPQEMPS